MELAQIDFKGLYKEIGSSGGAIEVGNLTLGGLVTALLPYLFAIAGLLLLLYLLYGGLSLMLARGDPKAVEGAKEKITFGVAGFIIVFASFWIVQIVGRVLGIQAIKDIFG